MEGQSTTKTPAVVHKCGRTGVCGEAVLEAIAKTRYVDDLLLLATNDDVKKHWAIIEGEIEFKSPGSPPRRFVGAHHNVDQYV